ncbi:extracellular solute-binding protein [Inquilinus sp.]|uniref:ABC transporter substrate-binding protein n=1 Tax=Inquilinus sp. TaxID=1932117 RepID=UPI0031DDAC14
MARWQASIAAFGLSIITALSLTATAHAESDPALIEAAKKEGTVTWASGLIVNQAVRPVAAAFEKKYGIQVQIATADNLLLRMTNEARAGKPTIDIFDNAGDTIAAMRAADLIVPYASPEAERYRPEHKDPEHYWASCCVFYYSTVINTDLVPPEEEPKTYQDLLDPKWKGKLAWSSNENFAGPPSFIGTILLSKGETDGMAYLEQLAKQDVVRVPGNARAVLDQVIVGQYPIAVVALIHHVAISGAQGAPVKWLKLGPLVGTAETVGLVKGAPHPNAAKLLFDFLLSEEGQLVLQQANYLPADPNVPAKVPELKPDAGGFTAVAILPQMNDEYLPKWLDLYKRLFVRG